MGAIVISKVLLILCREEVSFSKVITLQLTKIVQLIPIKFLGDAFRPSFQQ